MPRSPGSPNASPHRPTEHRVVLRRSSSWLPSVRWGELWEYRELLYFLVWRDVKIRYKQAVLGGLWAILQPLLSMLVFTAVFGKLARIPSDGIPYPVFVYCGLLPWTYFANALTGASNSLVGSAHLITKVYFPRLMVPAAATVSGLLDLAVAFPILLALMAWSGVPVASSPTSLLALPLLVLLAALLALGVGTWLAALNVRYRDVRYAIPFLVQVWMFATPIVYPMSLAPERYRWVIALNPMAGVVEGFRAAVLGRPMPIEALAVGIMAAFVFLVAGLGYFQHVERSFADVV